MTLLDPPPTLPTGRWPVVNSRFKDFKHGVSLQCPPCFGQNTTLSPVTPG
jgi:hypothetical protein